VENGVGVAEKFLRKAWMGETGPFAVIVVGVRNAGISVFRSSEVAIVPCYWVLQWMMAARVVVDRTSLNG